MSKVDLSALRMQERENPLGRRPRGPRILAAGTAILVVVVVATFVWPLLRSARAVPMARVTLVDAGGTPDATGGTTATAAEAVGWVEPDPFPTVVLPLVMGHIETLEVLEGSEVRANETIVARMVSAELQAARDRAVAAVAEREATLRSAEQSTALAERRLEQNAEARTRVIDAQTRAAMVATRLAATRERVAETAAAARSARSAAIAQERLEASGGSSPVALERARAERDRAERATAAAAAELTGLEAEAVLARDAAQLAEELERDPVDLAGAAAVARAQLTAAAAALQAAQTELTIAERELGWATVRSPVDGIVLRLLTEPGAVVGHGAAGIVEIYDPARLRARIDVPLDSVTGVRAGQDVEIRSEVLGDAVVRGVVQRLQHESDLLKNTLQVKVGLIDPPALLRPETLCRARFLAGEKVSGPTGSVAADTSGLYRLPRAAVRDGNVFVYDPRGGVARAVPVQHVRDDGDAVLVRGELSTTQKVVLVPVAAGEAITEEQR